MCYNPNKNIVNLFTVLTILVLLCSSTMANVLEHDNQVWLIKYQVGDSLKWADNSYKDNYWSNLFFADDEEKIQTDSQYVWIRAKVLLSPNFKQKSNYELFNVLTGTYEVYWNGNLIGNNCSIGNNITNNSGNFLSNIKIPDSLINSQSNLLALRIIKKRNEEINIGLLSVDTHNGNKIIRYIFFFWILLPLLVYIILSVYFVKKSTKDQPKVKYILFAVLSGIFAISTLSYLMITSFNLNYKYFYIAELLESFVIVFLSVILPFYFTYEFNLPYKKIVCSMSTIILLTISTILKVDFEITFIFSLIISLLILVWAIYKKQYSSYFALFGLLSILPLIIYGILDNIFIFGLPIFALFIIIDASKEATYRKLQYIDSQLKSSQLEIELFRKFIQPHYILNSLNSVVEWLEEEPAKGVEFITALSDEFHILSKITSKKLISVDEEIKICRAHLKIMSFRKSINYSLKVKNVNKFNTIPPALFHTLIENGITHNQNNKLNKIEFTLSEEKIQNGRQYILTNSNFNNFNSIELTDTEKNSFGVGFKYIKARLNESYGTNWELVSGQKGNDWETVIEIFE